jgi:hypothetical protein
MKIPFYVNEKKYKKLSSQLAKNLKKAPSAKNGGKIKEIF